MALSGKPPTPRPTHSPVLVVLSFSPFLQLRYLRSPLLIPPTRVAKYLWYISIQNVYCTCIISSVRPLHDADWDLKQATVLTVKKSAWQKMRTLDPSSLVVLPFTSPYAKPSWNPIFSCKIKSSWDKLNVINNASCPDRGIIFRNSDQGVLHPFFQDSQTIL